MTTELTYGEDAAAGYERAFAHVSTHFVPFLVRAARLALDARVLDIASGTGLAAEAALAAVGKGGHVTAADMSPAMAEKARARFAGTPNATVSIENGQSMSFPDESFDAVLCSLGLMFFPDPAQGLSEFRRVLRPGGWAAVSVPATLERSYNGKINRAVARYAPSLAETNARFFALGDEAPLRSLFEGAGFGDVSVATETHRFEFSSFDAYFGPFERGGGSTGQAFLTLAEEQRQAVREEMRREVGDTGGPIGIEVDIRIASGRR
ncbi:class I SAM-dependent methyltransferase [Sabulicella glaciei]|uniref:Methyltransferase domain-containing protein n=1 Tax=Sabulicella glaciei TaxID=2984948 RepID=A0ABT3P238_9PROT|nr:methyltransferase domain-containing protein [Roseococcus sp. MDT2-1-1]MCW8088461.1 methyltransferase domain-containing protein [Roseococcus sp. MDT2-1-1]